METIIQQKETDTGKHNAPMIPDEIKKEIRNYFLTAASEGYKVSMNCKEQHGYKHVLMSATDGKGKSVYISGKYFEINLFQVISTYDTFIHVYYFENMPFGFKSWQLRFDGREKEWLNNLFSECQWIAEKC